MKIYYTKYKVQFLLISEKLALQNAIIMLMMKNRNSPMLHAQTQQFCYINEMNSEKSAKSGNFHCHHDNLITFSTFCKDAMMQKVQTCFFCSWKVEASICELKNIS